MHIEPLPGRYQVKDLDIVVSHEAVSIKIGFLSIVNKGITSIFIQGTQPQPPFFVGE